MSQSFSFPGFTISCSKKLILNSTVAFGLIISPYAVHANQDSVRLTLQAAAEENAQELGGVTASDKWTRIEFSNIFIDPIVVVEPIIEYKDNSYMVGIRNIDASGFEISLKSCDDSIAPPLQEMINYSVIEHSQISSSDQTYTHIHQPFAWGECPAQSAG